MRFKIDDVRFNHRRSYPGPDWLVQDALVGAGVKPGPRALLQVLHRLAGDALRSKMGRSLGGVEKTFSQVALAELHGTGRVTVSNQLTQLEDVGAVEERGSDPTGTRIWIATEEALLDHLFRSKAVKDHLEALYAYGDSGYFRLIREPSRAEIAKEIDARRRSSGTRRRGSRTSAPKAPKKRPTGAGRSPATALVDHLMKEVERVEGGRTLSRHHELMEMNRFLRERDVRPGEIKQAISLLTSDWPHFGPLIGSESGQPTAAVLNGFWPVIKVQLPAGGAWADTAYDARRPTFDAAIGTKVPAGKRSGRAVSMFCYIKREHVSRERWDEWEASFDDTPPGWERVRVRADASYFDFDD